MEQQGEKVEIRVPLNVASYSSKKQKGGKFAPAFPAPSYNNEEDYIERMIRRDKEMGLY